MILVDSNVLLDLFTADREWASWSRASLEQALAGEGACINPIVFAEVSLAFAHQRELTAQLDLLGVERHALPYGAAFGAGRAFLTYRRRGGARRSPLPDFYIGSHAASAGLRLLTRDDRRYRDYFPSVSLIAPE